MNSSDDHDRGKHRRTAAKVDAGGISVRLSPELTRSLGQIEAAVHDSSHFSPEILENLQEYATAKPFSSVGTAFIAIATITRATMKHVHATGDKRAEEALDSFISDFIEQDQDKRAFTLESNKRVRSA